MGKLEDEEYLGNALSKMDKYIAKGILIGQNLIVTYERKEGGLNTRNLEKLLRGYLEL